MYKSTYLPSLNYTVPRKVSALKGVTDDAQRWVLKGIVASAATYAVKTAVDIAANPENMQKVAQLVSEQQVGA